MEYTDQCLADLIYKIDAQKWVYNYHRSKCGSFMYDSDIKANKCRKCGAVSKNLMTRAIPFSTSATAIEKIIMWLKSKGNNEPYYTLLMRIISHYNDWAFSNRSPDTYRMHILIDCIDYLARIQ